jgi:hypothetical protein
MKPHQGRGNEGWGQAQVIAEENVSFYPAGLHRFVADASHGGCGTGQILRHRSLLLALLHHIVFAAQPVRLHQTPRSARTAVPNPPLSRYGCTKPPA